MSDLAGIRQLARQLARQNAPRSRAQRKIDLIREVERQNLREIPPPLWDELGAHLDHNPSLGLALARVLYAIAGQGRNLRAHTTAELALIRALNVCGEFRQALEMCAGTGRRFEEQGNKENRVRVWLEAAWAQSYLGDLKAAEVHLETATLSFPALLQSVDLIERFNWIRGRILRERGEFKNALREFKWVRQQLLGADKTLDAARVLREIGHTLTRLDPSKGLESLEQASEVFREEQCPTEIAHCEYFLAQSCIDLNDFDKAQEKLRYAQKVFQRHGLAYFDADCDLEFGFLACELEHFKKSLVYTMRARAIFLELEAQQELSSCEVNLGWALMRLNRYAEALPYLNHAAQIALDTGRQTKAAVCFSNIGLVHEKQGYYAHALEFHQRARDIFAHERMMERLVESDLDLGQLYFQLGAFDQARSVLARARRVCQREGMSASLATCELYRAHILFRLHKFALARRALRMARKLFVKNRLKTSTAVCERLLARLHSKDPRTARAYLASSRQIFSANKLLVDAALCEITRADLALEWGEWREAQDALRRAQRVLGTSFPDQTWRIAFGLGNVAQARNDIHGARQHYLQGAHALAHLRGNLRLEKLSNEAYDTRRHALDGALAFMEQHALAHDALTLIETAKAQTFVHTLAIHKWRTANHDHGNASTLIEKEQALRYALDQARAKLLTIPVAEPIEPTRSSFDVRGTAQSFAQLDKLERAYERVAEQQRLAQEGLTGAPTLEPFDLGALRAVAKARWGSDWSALDYYFANGRLYTLWITCGEVRISATRWSSLDQRMLEECAATHPDLREVVYRRTLHGLRVNTTVNSALEYLAQRLVPEPLLESRREQIILVSPHGLLHQLPFQALHVRDIPLLERFALLYTPNLQAFTQLATSHARQEHSPWLLYGASSFGDRAAPLKHTRGELDAIEKLARSQSAVYRQDNATRAQLLEWNRTHALARFEVLHFATHAVIESHAPHTSRILLNDQDLTVLDVTELNLDARLVTLSACSSAIGKGGSGDEWLGLTRAFFYAGARTIVASQWAVEDDSTAHLMSSFYENLKKGEPIPQALRRAQLTLHRQGFSAYHWAPFMAFGAG